MSCKVWPPAVVLQPKGKRGEKRPSKLDPGNCRRQWWPVSLNHSEGSLSTPGKPWDKGLKYPKPNKTEHLTKLTLPLLPRSFLGKLRTPVAKAASRDSLLRFHRHVETVTLLKALPCPTRQGLHVEAWTKDWTRRWVMPFCCVDKVEVSVLRNGVLMNQLFQFRAWKMLVQCDVGNVHVVHVHPDLALI